MGVVEAVNGNIKALLRRGRGYRDTIGAIQSLNESQITLRNGLEVELTSGDTYPLKGIAEYSDSEHIWVARFDLDDLRDKEIGRHHSFNWRNSAP
jgi:hypothetical protein